MITFANIGDVPDVDTGVPLLKLLSIRDSTYDYTHLNDPIKEFRTLGSWLIETGWDYDPRSCSWTGAFDSSMPELRFRTALRVNALVLAAQRLHVAGWEIDPPKISWIAHTGVFRGNPSESFVAAYRPGTPRSKDGYYLVKHRMQIKQAYSELGMP
jgi:hypothetical protein